MNFIKKQKFIKKIMILPVTALFALTLLLIISVYYGSINNNLLNRIETGNYPALEMKHDIYDLLIHLQHGLQDAVSRQDEDILSEVDILRDSILIKIKHGYDNPLINKEELDSWRESFISYYTLARNVCLQMMNGNFSEEITNKMIEMTTRYNEIKNELINTTRLEKQKMVQDLSSTRENQRVSTWNIGIITFILISLLFTVSFYLTKIITSPLHQLVNSAEKVAEGKYDIEIHVDTSDELGTLAKTFNTMVKKIKETLSQVEEQNWIKTGQTEVNIKMRGEQELNEIAQNILSFVAEYLQAQIGAIYIKNSSDSLHLVGSYAYKKRKSLSNQFKIGEGLIGQSALEKKSILLTSVPDDYIRINSGVGESSPNNIAVIPLIYNDDVKGVIELGTLYEFSDKHIEFLELISENVSVAFQTAQSRLETKNLLEETQKQAKELSIQQEQLQAANEELQSQQEELRVTNEELEEQTQALKASEETLKQQQEELQQSNKELEKQKQKLTDQKKEIEKKNEDLKIAREHIEKKAKELETTNKYKSEFMANMSHELRTPLNSILILSRLLSDNKNNNLTEKEIEFASTIHSSGADLLELINEILDLSKIEAGKMIVEIGKMNIKKLPDYVNQNFKHIAEKKNLYLNIKIEKDIPVKIMTDRRRIEQILKNLLSNALKFTKKGGITVRIHRPSPEFDLSRSGLEHKKTVCISVIDTGLGISKKKQLLIFEAFQQADGSTSRKFGGTGLGLSISRELAKLLKGEIILESEEGKGSTFSLCLPETISVQDINQEKVVEDKEIFEDEEMVQIQENENKAIEEEEKLLEKFQEQIDLISTETQGNFDTQKSILIIEDDEKFANILADLTHDKGFKSIIANDGESGIKSAQEYKPDAIILDIGLPKKDGWEVMDELKKKSETKNIPVYFMSAHSEKSTAMKMGAIGYLTKPISIEKLNEAFNQIETTVKKNIKKLLIVEDNKNLRDSLIKLIGNEYIITTAVGEGKEAYKLLKTNMYDCMVLDLGLNDISGFDLLKKIRDDKSIVPIPIIIYTGKDLTKNEEKLLRQHSESIIIKGEKSQERLLDEISLFLHKLESNLQKNDNFHIQSFEDTEKVFKNKTILLVDDDVRNIFALTSVLEEKELKVVSAENGKEALEQLDNNSNVDLILMDIMMPEMDGYETIREIRKRKNFVKLPIIALTAKAMKGDKQKCIDAGANDYLAKPINIEGLFSLLQVWLSK